MSVQSETSKVSYNGNASNVDPYTVPFYFLNETDLVVVTTSEEGVDDLLALNTDYTVTGAGEQAGGEVVTATGIPVTSTVTIYREVEALQNTSYEEADAFPAKSHERALDQLTMLCQQVIRAAKRSYRLRESDGDLDELAAVANTVVGLNGSKQPRTFTGSELASFLNLSQQYFDRPIKTFADAGERAIAVPEFAGQLGTQRDNKTLWIATGVLAGNWTSYPGTGGILTAELMDGILTADADGLAKMADGYLAASTAGRAKMADAFVTLAKIGAGIFTADGAGRGKFAAGFVDSGLLAAGAALANMPAGTVIQTVMASTNAASTVTSPYIPADDSIPQSNEGTQIVAATITPTSATNKILVTMVLNATTGSTDTFTMALFKDLGANALTAVRNYGVGYCHQLVSCYLDSPATVAATTYKMKAASTGVALYVNGNVSGTRMYGGVCISSILLQEIKA